MSSMQMRITSGLRRTSTPTVPRMNRIAPRSRNQDVSSCEPPASNPLMRGPREIAAIGGADFAGYSPVIPFATAEVDGADRRHQQEDRGQLERIEVGGEQADPDRLHGAEGAEVGLLRLPVLDALQHRPQETEQSEHEQEQDHDRAGVDDDLRDEDELGAEKKKEDRQRDHHHDEAEHAADGLAECDHADASRHGQGGGDEEDDDRQRYFGPFESSRACTSDGSGSSSFSLV